jgi:hypothetical protein
MKILNDIEWNFKLNWKEIGCKLVQRCWKSTHDSGVEKTKLWNDIPYPKVSFFIK